MNDRTKTTLDYVSLRHYIADIESVFKGAVGEVLYKLREQGLYFRQNSLTIPPSNILEFLTYQYEVQLGIVSALLTGDTSDIGVSLNDLMTYVVIGCDGISMGDEMPLRLFYHCWKEINQSNE